MFIAILNYLGGRCGLVGGGDGSFLIRLPIKKVSEEKQENQNDRKKKHWKFHTQSPTILDRVWVYDPDSTSAGIVPDRTAVDVAIVL